MAKDEFQITIKGYWRNANRSSIPKVSGVYIVYECFFNEYNNSVTLLSLLYIGQSENINQRISDHEKTPEWKRKLDEGNELCFGFAEVLEQRERVEAALIFKHKPPCNTEYITGLPFGTTTVLVSGASGFITQRFTV